MLRAFASQSVDMGSIPLSSHTKNLNNDIHRSTWCSTIEIMWRVQHVCDFTQSRL